MYQTCLNTFGTPLEQPLELNPGELRQRPSTYPIELGQCHYFNEIFFANIPIIKTKLLFGITSSMRKS